MKITSISQAARNPDRVNISVDGKYRFSLDIFQVGELGIKVGREYTDAELSEFQTESEFGKLYARTLEYTMIRPHSAREIRDYLWRKTRASKYKTRKGEIKDREGVSQVIADRVFDRLVEKGYIDDEKFTRFWVENRNATKGTSRRKLMAELRAKGVENAVVEGILDESERNDASELMKMIERKYSRYEDDQKLMAYLARQGFGYDDIKSAIAQYEEQNHSK